MLEAQTEPVAEFDEPLRGAMVDYVTVRVDGGMTVVVRNGAEISCGMTFGGGNEKILLKSHIEVILLLYNS